MKVYASISGGKDSLAALITHMERGGQCDGAIYCRIMFDDETSAEVPEHEEWLHSKRSSPGKHSRTLVGAFRLRGCKKNYFRRLLIP